MRTIRVTYNAVEKTLRETTTLPNGSTLHTVWGEGEEIDAYPEAVMIFLYAPPGHDPADFYIGEYGSVADAIGTTFAYVRDSGLWAS